MAREDESRPSERLLGLALAKGWIGRSEVLEGPEVGELVARGRLSQGQAEALAMELARAGHRPLEEDAPTETTTLFHETWSHFEDLTLLAEGGMGRIFKALDQRLQRRVAVKLLRRDDPELAARFLREASLQAQVEHPNVCRIYEAGEWKGQAYIAMQLIEGETLKVAARRMTLEDKLDVMIQVCEGVHAAHQQGLIHRDLKPTNLMVRLVEGSWRAFVLDFGLARTVSATGLTQSGVVMGTVHYMSPQQAKGQDRSLDRRADVYALGATLYELFAGEPPFAQYQGLEALGRILAEDAEPLRRKAPQVPRDLETVVMKCLDRNRDRRYDQARQLAGELRRVLDGEPVEGRPISPWERGWRWMRRNRLGMVAGAGALMALGLFGALALRSKLEARRAQLSLLTWDQVADRFEAVLRLGRRAPEGGWADLEARLRVLGLEASELTPAQRHARGRILLALGRAEEAAQELEQAWAEGARGPATAWPLGLALEGRLQAEGELARKLEAPDLERAWRLQEAERLKPRILALLREGAPAAPESIPLREAHLAAAEGHDAEALLKVREALALQPWQVEARLLEADLRVEGARREADPHRARPHLEAALEALRAAGAQAPRDGRIALREARIHALLEADGPSSAARWANLARAEADPGTSALASLERAWMGRAEGPEAPQAFEALAQRLAALHPRWLTPALLLGQAQLLHPGAPHPKVLEDLRGLARSRPEHPLVVGLLHEGLLQGALRELAERGQPGSAWEEALQTLRGASRAHPDRAFPAFLEGRLLLAAAERDLAHGRDPRARLDAATTALGRSLALRPAEAPAQTCLARVHLLRGRQEAATGHDAEASFSKARRAAFRALELDPRDPEPCGVQGWTSLAQAERAAALGRPLGPWLQEVRRWALRCRELAPRTVTGEVLLLRAALLEGPRTAWEQAARELARKEGAEGDLEAQLALGWAALRSGRWEAAVHHARKGGELEGPCAEAQALALEGLTKLADQAPDGPARADLQTQAEAARARLLTLNPLWKPRGGP